MFDSGTPTPAKRKTRAVSKKSATRLSPVSIAVLEDKIRERAHQIYEDRGREPGRELQDWVQAEDEILNPQL
jgi:Protein of unknown function (DUF2934)